MQKYNGGESATDVSAKGMVQRRRRQIVLRGICWGNSSRESSKCMKFSDPLIRRNAPQSARPMRWPLGIMEWTFAGDFLDRRFLKNSKSKELYRLRVEVITRDHLL
jgi:hypothetical protein